jgi:nitrate reductase assembly molybdenum cofactor insertion protein NarJ
MNRDLLLETAEWRLLGLLFEYPAGDWRSRVAALAAEVRDDELRSAAQAAMTEASEGMHYSIFGPGGPAPPREATYTRGVQLGYLLSELAAYYDAFAYRPEKQEPVDHVAVEVGYVAYLKLKQAYASAIGNAEHAAVCRAAGERFVAEHLSMMAAPLSAALEPIAPSYLVLAGRSLLRRVGPPAEGISGGQVIQLSEDEDLGCADHVSEPLVRKP